MAFDRFLIAPLDIGLQTDLKPWLISDSAFAELTNAYLFRGRVRKRFGSRYMSSIGQLGSRLRIALGVINPVTFLFAGNIATLGGGTIWKVGQMFSIGDNIYTVYQDGALLETGTPIDVATYNIATGAFSFDDSTLMTLGGETVYFYPSEPVMGIKNYETGAINDQPVYAWDTQFCYVNDGDVWERSITAATDDPRLRNSTSSNFVWMANWRGETSNFVDLFNSNFQVTNKNGAGTTNDDPIWWLNVHPTTGVVTWTPGFERSAVGTDGYATTDSWFFAPIAATSNPVTPSTMGPYVRTARIIMPFKNRLLLLNTVENSGGVALGTNSHYGNRCRYSWNGSPFAVNAWYETNRVDMAGNKSKAAGWIDAPTTEEIISAEFIKDRLIVYFEQSTWEIVYTANYVKPFVWQQINSELGSQSQQSTVPFDKVVLTVGNTGVHACNGSNVERVDEKIPDQVFRIKNKNNGVSRVAGIRDYYNEMVYWAFPSTEEDNDFTFPTKVLVYNYRNQSWALNEDCITSFGYFEQSTDVTWASTNLTWEEYDATWRSGFLSANARQLLAGNQQGFVYIVDATLNINAPVMQLSKIELGVPGANIARLTIRDHTLSTGNYIRFGNYIPGAVYNGLTIGGLGNPYYQVTNTSIANHTVDIDMEENIITGTYTGGGTVARVSMPKIKTKQFNPYVDKAANTYLAKVDFCVQKTTGGELRVDYFPSFAQDFSMINEGEISGAQLGTNILETSPYATVSLEALQDTLWHTIYFQTVGENIQLYISLSDAQMRTPIIANAAIQIEGMILYTQPVGRLQ